ncbi:MAG: complex I NDUFA9 subunit family protein [Candidatus Obscuribacterales bacterium]|nr:complex I NDUFA9 subunit family protein [Candidatus Obscuribacterales bacterium]
MILVVGATGLIGSRVVELLLKEGQQEIRVLARGGSDWEGSLLPHYRRSGIDVIVGDIRDEQTVKKALTGCNAVVNCSGLMRATSKYDIEEVNIEGVENLVHIAQDEGIQRFIHLSCLGATEYSTGRYFRSKWEGERVVRQSKFYWTIFRPSLIFGQGSMIERTTNFWLKRAPFTLVVGSGLNRFQPISADVVAECIVQSIFNRECVGQTYDLVGPDAFDLSSVLGLVSADHGKEFRCLKIPSVIGIKIAEIFGKLNPKSPIDGQTMSMLTTEMLGDSALMLKTFNVKMIPFQSSLKAIGSAG